MAIDFPATSGQATDGSYTHTASGITWAWDGTTWKAQGVTGSYVLPTASATVLGGVKVGTGLSINSSTGVLTATGGGGGGSQTLDQVLATGNTTTRNIDTTGKIYFGNVFSTLTDLQNVDPATYHGMFAHVHATGKGYFSHAGQWIQLLDTSSSINELSDVTISSPSTGQVLKYNGSAWVNDTDATGGGGATLGSRQTFTATTASLANNVAGNVDVTAYKSYSLLKIKPSIAAWVTLYVDAASRTADANRVQGADPAPDAGVIAEVITTAANQEIKMSPGVLGWHQDGSNDAVDTVFCKVVNKSGSTGTCTVSLTVVQLEA